MRLGVGFRVDWKKCQGGNVILMCNVRKKAFFKKHLFAAYSPLDTNCKREFTTSKGCTKKVFLFLAFILDENIFKRVQFNALHI